MTAGSLPGRRWVGGGFASVATIGLAIGAVVAATMVDPVVVVAGLLAIIGGILILQNPEWGLLAIAAFTVLRLPDVAADFHGAPSLFTPLLGVVLVAVVVQARASGIRPTGGLRAAGLAGSYVLLAMGSLLFADVTAGATSAVVELAKDAAVAVVVGMLLRSTDTLRRLTWVLVLGGGALASLSVIQFLSGTFDNEFLGFAQSSVQEIVTGTDDVRIAGPIGDPNFYAQWLVMIVPLAIDRFHAETDRRLRVLAGASAGLASLAVIFTFSRGGAVALGVVILGMLIRHPPKARTVVAVAIAGVLAVPLLPPGYVDRLSALAGVGSIDIGVDSSVRGRTAQIGAAWEMFTERPLTGLGYGTYKVNYPEYTRSLGIEISNKEREAHNLYLEVAAETGIPGVIALGTLIVAAFGSLAEGRRQLRRSGRGEGDDTGYAVAMALVGYLITSVFLHMAFARFAWLLFGIAYAFPSMARAERRRAREPVT